MKKEIIIIFTVIAMVLIFNTIAESHTDSIMNQIEESLMSLREDLLEEDKEKVKQGMDKTNEEWEQEKNMLAIYVEHNELEKIELYLTEIESNVETEEYNMAIQSLDTCNFIMEHIKDKYKFALKNIF